MIILLLSTKQCTQPWHYNFDLLVVIVGIHPCIWNAQQLVREQVEVVDYALLGRK